MTEQYATAIPVELRSAEGQRRLHGCLLQEGRIALAARGIIRPGCLSMAR